MLDMAYTVYTLLKKSEIDFSTSLRLNFKKEISYPKHASSRCERISELETPPPKVRASEESESGGKSILFSRSQIITNKIYDRVSALL
jgi:hypothetical protein